VRKAFELYGTGRYNLRTPGEELHRMGLRNRHGGRFTRTGLSKMLNHNFYISIIRIQRTGEHYQGIHETFIPKSLFDRVQGLLKGKVKSRGWMHTFLYRQTFRCAQCSKVLSGERQKEFVYYRCHTTCCPRTSLREDEISVRIQQERKSCLGRRRS